MIINRYNTLSNRKGINFMRKYIFYIIAAFAVLGLSSQLFYNPTQLVKRVAIIGLITIGMIFLLRFFLYRRRYSSPEMRKYRQAVKQSQQRYKHNRPRKTQSKGRRPSRRRASHLRVIDGRKSK